MIVVDTNIVVKWAVEEAGADEARRFIGQELFAPDLLVFELGHALTKKVRLRELEADDARLAFSELPKLIELVASRPLDRRAFELSIALHHGLYDCYFLALAEAMDSVLVTADRIIAAKAQATDLSRHVRLIAGGVVWE